MGCYSTRNQFAEAHFTLAFSSFLENSTTYSPLPSIQIRLAAIWMPTVLSTVSVHGIIGLGCTRISSECAMPVQVVLFPTPQKANRPSLCITFQSKRPSWFHSLMHILQESIRALMIWRYTWLHAVAWLALPLWNPYSTLIPKFLHLLSRKSHCAMDFVTQSSSIKTANSLGSAVKRLASFKSTAMFSLATTITQWW